MKEKDEVKRASDKVSNLKALRKLLVFFKTKSAIGRSAEVSRNTVGQWFTRGAIGKQSAIFLDKKDDVPFTKEQLRKDVSDWSKYKFKK